VRFRLPETSKNHDAGLERPDTTAGLIDSQDAAFYLDQVSMLQRRNMKKI
jgi:hypothetical protein